MSGAWLLFAASVYVGSLGSSSEPGLADRLWYYTFPFSTQLRLHEISCSDIKLPCESVFSLPGFLAFLLYVPVVVIAATLAGSWVAKGFKGARNEAP